MPEITPLGWFHTGTGVLAIIVGIYALARHKVILVQPWEGKAYLLLTLVTAATSLGIYNQGGFGPAHILGVLTLLALLVGSVAAFTDIVGKWSPYLQALSYSATFLFHSIPAITDGLLRLPVGAPVLTTPEHPLLLGFYLLFLAMYVAGAGWQMLWLRRTTRS